MIRTVGDEVVPLEKRFMILPSGYNSLSATSYKALNPLTVVSKKDIGARMTRSIASWTWIECQDNYTACIDAPGAVYWMRNR